MVNGRNKGSSNELKIAKMLTKWAGVEFTRVPMSGGLRWQEDNNVTGDIVPPFELQFPISIECKKVEASWEFDKLMLNNSEIWDWWAQTLRDSIRYKTKSKEKEPWLVFTKNYRKYYIMMSERSYKKLSSYIKELCSLPTINVLVSEHNTYLLDFEDFLNMVDLQTIMKLSF